MKYARVLLGHCPKQTTKLFIDYYTGQFQPKARVEEQSEEKPQASEIGVQNLTSLISLPYRTAPNEVYTAKSAISEPQVATDVETPSDYEKPKPRTAFSSFVDQPEEFVAFLEALVKQQDLNEEDKVDLYTTLFEMYLDFAHKEKDDSEKMEWEKKAKSLIEGNGVSSFAYFFCNDHPYYCLY